MQSLAFLSLLFGRDGAVPRRVSTDTLSVRSAEASSEPLRRFGLLRGWPMSALWNQNVEIGAWLRYKKFIMNLAHALSISISR